MRRRPGIGDLVYLASYLIRVRVSAQTTAPDTPNQYAADLEVMGDAGDLDTSALVGLPGPGGQQTVAFRRQDDAKVNSPQDLPTDLTDLPKDVGRYWLIDTVNDEGVVTEQIAWTWYGTGWRTFVHGTFGPPGAVPKITVHQELIEPGQTSYVHKSSTTFAPSWQLKLAQPAGPSGPITPLGLFPDVDNSIPVAEGDLLACGSKYTSSGAAIWRGLDLDALHAAPYSMPESAFIAYHADPLAPFVQEVPIGSYVVEPQPYDWTPIVWGHIGEYGLNLSGNPLLIGCRVLLGDPDNGVQIGRGLGSMLGRVSIKPHYSTPATPIQAITPTNRYAMIPANHTDPALSTIFVSLFNDGQLSVFDFEPGGAQIFIMAVPVNVAAQIASEV
jgi:hypothetical protein